MKISNAHEYAGNPAKEAAREQFERSGGIKQDRHTGKGTNEDRGPNKEMKSEFIEKQQREIEREQIRAGLEAWKNGQFSEHHDFDSPLDPSREALNWKEVLEAIHRTPFENAMMDMEYRGQVSQEEYVKMQEEVRKKLEQDKKEAWEERKRRNFSKTGDPHGDRSKTSLVH